MASCMASAIAHLQKTVHARLYRSSFARCPGGPLVPVTVFESLPLLIKAASFLEYRGETTAFFDFTHQKKITQSSYAMSLLHILSDPHFCETLVTRTPWRLAAAIKQIGTEQLYARSAQAFISQVAYQAIIRDDSIIARETGYHGF